MIGSRALSPTQAQTGEQVIGWPRQGATAKKSPPTRAKTGEDRESKATSSNGSAAVTVQKPDDVPSSTPSMKEGPGNSTTAGAAPSVHQRPPTRVTTRRNLGCTKSTTAEEADMQMQKAAKLREAWAKNGGEPCHHPQVVKEYHLGADTGDVVCTTCGETWWHNDPERPDR